MMSNEGMRLNKYLSSTGMCSRREADRLIEERHVTIHRKGEKEEIITASLGARVQEGDRVYVDGKEIQQDENKKLYMMLNKPRGIICTGDRRVKDNVIDFAGLSHYISYAGRLDRESTGLLLLTNDGDLNDRIIRAANFHEKEYVVKVDRPITQGFLDAMRGGMEIVLDDDRHARRIYDKNGQETAREGLHVMTRPCTVKQLTSRKFSIILTQGFNRQIRRMCAAQGYTALEIKRIRIMNLELGDLKEGRKRFLTAEEIKTLKELASMPLTQEGGQDPEQEDA